MISSSSNFEPFVVEFLRTLPRFFKKLSTTPFALGQAGVIRRCLKPSSSANSSKLRLLNGAPLSLRTTSGVPNVLNISDISGTQALADVELTDLTTGYRE